jgi:hypothetical protein
LEAFREGQKGAVAPQIRGSCLNIFACKTAARGIHVVRDFERRKAFVTERPRLIAPQLAAFTTLKLKMFGHIFSLLS